MFIPLFDGAMIVFPSFIGVPTENLFAKNWAFFCTPLI
jgi:hypothetical protein